MAGKTAFQNGLLYEQAAGFAQALETSQGAAVDQMLAAWTDSYWGVRGELDQFLAKVAAAKAAGTPPSPAWAFQQQRLKNLLDETKRQIARYAADATLVTTKAQSAAIAAALKHSESLAKAAITQGLPGYTVDLARVNPKVLEAGVGFLSDGSVLRNHLALTLPTQAATKVQEALIHGLATGKSQDWMVRAATQALGLSHTRATTIMRTESLRAYRHASRATYLANQDVLGTWVWNAHLDARTCVACALMDGTEHPLDATLDGHPRCRCAMVPRTKSWEDLGVTGVADTRPPVRSGKAWLEAQPAHVQRAMMGRAKFDAWTSGAISLDDMVARTYSPQWGTMRTERSLKAILEDRDPNYFDAPSVPVNAGPKPPAKPDMKYAAELADRHDLAYLNEWLDTPGNSPTALANIKAAIALKLARNQRPLGPYLPKPDMAKVKAAVEKLRQAVLTKGYPSKGYSQTKAVYKAQANGQVGTKVGVVKSLTWEQKITAQRILAEHDDALPDLARQWQKKEALAKAYDEALVIQAQKVADEAAEALVKDLDGKLHSTTVGHASAKTLYDVKRHALADDLVAAGDDPVKVAKVKAEQAALEAHWEAYEQAQKSILGNGWDGTTWKATGDGLLEVNDLGWGHVTSNLGIDLKVPPYTVQKMLNGESGTAKWTQVVDPQPVVVQAYVKDLTDADGFVDEAAYAAKVKALEDGNLTAQAQVNLQEAVDQVNAAGKWKPDEAVAVVWKADLDAGDVTVDDALAYIGSDPKPSWKAAVEQALADYQAEQIAKASIPVPKPAINPAKIKWEKVSEAQVQKLVTKVQSGEQSLDDLYAAFQKSKNAGPKANYAKAILTLEGKDVGDLVPPVTATVPKATGPVWPTKPPWKPEDLKFTGQTLGTHGARVYDAPDGTRWLFKPPKDPKDGFLASLDEAASRFQAMAGLKAPDTYVVTLGGKRGSIQRMFPASDGFPSGFKPAALSKADLDVVQREHALDWLLANHDGHRDQFLRLQDGTMVGIDKGQAFRWFGQDRLDWDFHPNATYGAPEPVYNALWREFARGGDVDLDPPGQGALWDQIATIQAIPDDQVRDLFREYAEQAAARGLLAKPQKSFTGVDLKIPPNDVEAFLDAIVDRKNRLADDFTDLYNRAAAQRAKAIPGWKPKAPKVTPSKAKWVGKPKPEAPAPPEAPDAQVAQVFTSWLDAAKARYSAFSGGKSLEASNNWARFRRVVDDLDEQAAKELLDRSYLDADTYQEALDLIAKAKAQKAALEGDYKRALAAHQKAVQAHKKDLADWKDANGITEMTRGMDDGVVRHGTNPAGLKWAEKHWDGSKYRGEQRKWLKSYTGSYYDSLNAHLRATKGKPTEMLDATRNIDKAMAHISIPEDVILHRGVGHARPGQPQFTLNGVDFTEKDDLTKIIGSVQVDHAFISTSVGNQAAFHTHPIQLKIRAPEGTPASLVTSFSNFGTAERELILGRGQRMYVHNAYKQNGKWFLEMEIVPEDFDPTNGTPTPSAKPWTQ